VIFKANNSESDGRKHPMFKGLRRHITYANIAATMAVVFAMSGGAYALSGNNHAPAASASAASAHAGKVKKRSKGAVGARGPAGPKGAAGATGAVGAQGLQGPAGERGPAGEKGAAGAAGKEGAQGPAGPAGPQGVPGVKGASVTSRTISGHEGECDDGGSEFKVGTTATYACNGTGGSGGSGGTLEQGKTERGDWSGSTAGATHFGPNTTFVALNYPIQLGEEKHETKFVYLKAGQAATAECPGTSEEPEAAEGYLCVYAGFELEATFLGVFNKSSFGSFLLFEGASAGGWAFGSWALTAGEPKA
jgi:hypothetical protein